MDTKYCATCGSPLAADTKFCPTCGAAVPVNTAYTPPPPEPEYGAPVYTPAPQQEPVYGGAAGASQAPAEEQKPDSESKYAPVSMWQFVGLNALMIIPVVNLILLIVWACGSGTKKVNQINWARGQLVWMGIGIVVSLLLMAALVPVFVQLVDMLEYYW